MEAGIGLSWGLFHRQYILAWKLYIHSSGRAAEAGWIGVGSFVTFCTYHGANEIEIVHYVFYEVPFW